MTNEEALLRAIRGDPDDELARSALADWLDDNGDPERAEFVRAQCQLARGVDDPAARRQLRDREAKLLIDNAPRWLGPFAAAANQCRYERGTAVVTLPAAALLSKATLAQAAEWFPRGWVLDLRLSGRGDLAPLLAQPWLDRLSRLRLEAVSLGERDLDELAGCEALDGLHSLTLSASGMAGRVARLAASPHLRSLRALALTEDKLTSADVASLGQGFPNLRRLNLSRNETKKAALDALLGAGWPEGLTSLQLVSCSLDPVLLKRLCASPRLDGLEELNLSGNYLRPDGAGQIARCERLTNLRRLGLRNSGIGGPGAASLASSTALASLEMLDVWDSGAGRSGLDRLRDRFGAALWMRLDEPPCWAY